MPLLATAARCPCVKNLCLQAQVMAGRRPEEEPEVLSLGTQRVSTNEAYKRALATQRTAASPFALAMGFMRAAFDTVTNPSVSPVTLSTENRRRPSLVSFMPCVVSRPHGL